MMQSQQIPMTFNGMKTKPHAFRIMVRKLLQELPGHLQMDEYGLDTICSLITIPDHQLIRRSLEKPVTLENRDSAVMARAKETSPIYELKKKYEGIVYKSPRAHDTSSEAVPHLAGKIRTGLRDSQILHEITWLRNYYRGFLSSAM